MRRCSRSLGVADLVASVLDLYVRGREKEGGREGGRERGKRVLPELVCYMYM